MSATTDRLQRARLLPAHIDIALAAADTKEARRASQELGEIAKKVGTDMLHAMAAQATGAVELAQGNAEAAISLLRPAWQMWHKLQVPYMGARVRVLIALACRTLGDHDSSEMELDAARSTFEQLGAAPDIARIDSLRQSHRSPSRCSHGLTRRELEVLRLLSVGKANKAIAAELTLSVKTVDRHVSNIFNKLDVPSRTAAAAYAYEHKLL